MRLEFASEAGYVLISTETMISPPARTPNLVFSYFFFFFAHFPWREKSQSVERDDLYLCNSLL